MSVDPLAEKYNWQTNYAFGSNQVVHSRELEGLEAQDDYNDGDDHDWNSGAQKDWTGEEGYTPPSAGGGGSEAPLDGNLDEVIVSNNHKEIFDKYDQIDKDRDGYGGKDDDRDGYGREDSSKQLHDYADNTKFVGSILTITGSIITVTGIGAPLGLALMAAGTGFAITGGSIDFAVDLFDGNGEFDLGSHAWDLAGVIVPELYEKNFTTAMGKEYGADNLIIESWIFGSDLWFEEISNVHK